jgi:hypothetical protein
MTQSITPEIKVRRINFEFPLESDRYWCGNSPFKTHLLNSFTLLLPDVEQYLIRAVRQRLKFIDNLQLKQDVRGFIGQEAQHSLQHSKFWDNLRASGYEIDNYISWVRVVLFNTLGRRLSLELNLAIGAGLEHLTTLLGEMALEGDFLADAEPNLRKLFEWHAAEEIEHKSVVFDVLQNASNSYLLRLVGMVISHIFVVGFFNLGLVMLLYQDKKLLDGNVWQEMIQFWFIREKFIFRALSNCLKYCKMNFHPSQTDNLFLLKKFRTS